MATTEAGHKPELAPPIDVLVAQHIASLCVVARMYLEPDDGRQPDFPSAEIAVELAGQAFERIQPRLPEQGRAAVAEMLTEIRLEFVRKRGI
jgi:hypothetical protein